MKQSSLSTPIKNLFMVGPTYAKRLKNKLGEIMFNNIGIIRNGDQLKNAINKLENMKENLESENDSALTEKLELLNGIDIAIATAKSALLREESRGAHFRLDYPESDHAFLHHTYIKLK